MTLSRKPAPFLRFAAFFLCLAASVSAGHILFIGNSFTHGHDPRLRNHGGVPAVFETIARGKGQEVDAAMAAPSGRDWGFHLKDPGTRRMLASRKWDTVVLQDFSTKPTRIGDRKAFFRHGRALCGLVWKHSPDATIVLYRTWARKPGHAMYSAPGRKSKFAGFDQMDGEIGESYASLFKKLADGNPGKRILLAPVGDAFALCVKESPETKIYGRDDYHASPQGSYLAALVFYKTIFGGDPSGAVRAFPTFEIGEEAATRLQAVAARVPE